MNKVKLLVLWRYEISARRSISIRFWMKNRDFDSIRFSLFSREYSVWNQSPKVTTTAIYRNHRIVSSLSKWTTIVLFICVNLEAKTNNKPVFESMLYLLLFTSRAAIMYRTASCPVSLTKHRTCPTQRWLSKGNDFDFGRFWKKIAIFDFDFKIVTAL